MARRPTMKDIAKETGFSLSTVSRALSNKPDVDVQTYERIWDAARQMGYRPNKLARSLRLSATQTIGVIIADISNPYFGALVKGIEKEARGAGHSVILFDTDEDYSREEEAVTVMLEEQVAGVILTPTQRESGTVERLMGAGLPLVLASRRFSHIKTSYVVTDDLHGGLLATEHLIALGHERIGMINGPMHISSASERFGGYREALRRHGLPLQEAFIATGSVSMEDGFKATTVLLERAPIPTAIFAFSDFVAFGVIKAIRENGLRVPEDVSVVGYDDNQFASCLETPLTTVHVPKEQLGMEAAQVLQRQIEGGQPLRQVELLVDLIERESTSQCP
jgi:LacI family transcriptional regulator